MRQQISIVLTVILILSASILPAFAAGEDSAANSTGFSDVADTSWYAGAVKAVKDLGLISGRSDGTFDPTGNLTVAEAITLAANTRAYYNKETIPRYYTCLISGVLDHWYGDAVAYALEHNIIDIYQFYDYQQNATRGEMASLFARALPEDQYSAINSITELPDVNYYTLYREEILRLYNAGIVAGSDSSGTFYPDRQVSRAEAAAILYRVVDSSKRTKLSL